MAEFINRMRTHRTKPNVQKEFWGMTNIVEKEQKQERRTKTGMKDNVAHKPKNLKTRKPGNGPTKFKN